MKIGFGKTALVSVFAAFLVSCVGDNHQETEGRLLVETSSVAQFATSGFGTHSQYCPLSSIQFQAGDIVKEMCVCKRDDTYWERDAYMFEDVIKCERRGGDDGILDCTSEALTKDVDFQFEANCVDKSYAISPEPAPE